MDALNRTYRVISKRLKNLVVEIDRDDWGATAQQLSETVTELLQRLHDNFDQRTLVCPEEELDTLTTQFDEHLQVIRALQSRIAAAQQRPATPSARSTTTSSATEFRLPTIDLPTFGGNVAEWPSYAARFEDSLSHFPALSAAQKFHYLQSSLRGTAKSVTTAMVASELSYQSAWELLREKYDNKRMICTELVRRILNLPTATTAGLLTTMVDTVREVLRTLHLMGRDMDSDVWLVPYLYTKLPPDVLQSWERAPECPKKEVPTLSALLEYVQAYAQTSTVPKNTQVMTETPSGEPSMKKQEPARAPRRCYECTLNHRLYQCPVFLKATLPDRWQLVRKHHLCHNCLSHGHRTNDCKGSPCLKCSKKHNTKLHPTKPEVACATVNPRVTVLSTACVTFIGRKGPVRARVLLDTGATASYLHEKVLAQLQQPAEKCRTQISTLNGETTFESSETNIYIRELDTEVCVLSCKQLPTCPIAPVAAPKEVFTLQLADDKFMTPSPLQGILGADIFAKILRGSSKTFGSLTALDTTLGWVMVGGASHAKTETAFTTVDQQIERFFELEEVPKKQYISPEQQLVEDNFLATTRILPDGRFQVRLPTKPAQVQVSENKQLAVARLKSMERRMDHDQQFKTLYHEQMNDALKSGHMVPINPHEAPTGPVSYLPHHGVLSASTTTKLRVVFDASAKTADYASVNDITMNAPKTQADLFAILLRFRAYSIALTADIRQMYKQIMVNPKQRDLQRIVWRAEPGDPVAHFQLTTVVWGTKCATFLATRTLNQIAAMYSDKHPLACKKLLHDFYIDDAMTGAESIEEVQEIKQTLSKLLHKHGFTLHKWACSDPRGLNSAATVRVKNIAEPLNADSQHCKALGIAWDVRQDCFQFNISVPQLQKVTKRGVLSQTGTIFDPMGWLAPVIIRPKLFIQALWHQGSDWDHRLSATQTKEWRNIIEDLNKVQILSIPRRIFQSPTNRVLCGFCDASEKAYAAVVYARTMTPVGPVIRLVAAKSKVAPMKATSLPRLELCAAVLLARLVETINDSLPEKLPITAWSDSTVALAWITAHPSNWKTFVANRVAEIQDTIPATNWRHIPGTDNPADCASRGISAEELMTHPLWWSGPDILKAQLLEVPPKLTTTEERKVSTFTTITKVDDYITAFSSVRKLFRIQAYVLRFCNNVKRGNARLNGPLTPDELQQASRVIIRQLQRLSFGEDYERLSKGKPLTQDSKLLKLAPFLKDGLIRVGGRLRHAPLQEDGKHPVVLPHKNQFTEKLIRELHRDHLHAGPQLLAAIIQKKYWFANMNSVIKKVLHKCPQCLRWRANAAQQMMADLPVARVTPSRPFTTTGVDMAGPLTLRTQLARGTRHYKAWVAIFICFSTRAIHLELVTALSADAFLAALHRFVSRRGRPQTIMSDNGTNFQAVATQIQKQQDPSTHEIKWQFNPPGAPHFGGLWEAGVKSMKYHLHRVVGDTPFTYEEIATVLTRIEACLNSRPLTALSSDPSDLRALTPAHFLIGGDLLSVPEPEQPPKLTALKRWELTQQKAQHFWKRWSSEYLTRLQQRPKWAKPKTNLQVGQLVLLKEDMSSPLHWKLGRITAVHPGPDDLIRAATVKTALREFKRPVIKLCPLPLDT